jgi:hypothetical protein
LASLLDEVGDVVDLLGLALEAFHAGGEVALYYDVAHLLDNCNADIV